MSPEARDVLNRGLRLALAAALGLSAEALRGATLPALAPLIAVQLLAAVPGPPGARLVAMLVGVAAAASAAAWLVAAATLGTPGLYAIGMGLLYLWCFAMVFTPRLAPLGVMALTMTVVVGGLAATSTGLAAGIALELLSAFGAALALVYLAHALFPRPAGPPPPQADAGGAPRAAARRAGLAVAVLLPLHLWLTAGGVPAFVVLMTTATLLRQPGLAESLRFSVTSVIGNALGGLAAAAAAVLTALHDEPAVAVALTAAISLLLATQAAAGGRRAAVFLPGLVTFVLLYGAALGPGGDADVGALLRVAQVALAAVWAVGAASVLAPLFFTPRGREAAG